LHKLHIITPFTLFIELRQLIYFVLTYPKFYGRFGVLVGKIICINNFTHEDNFITDNFTTW